MFRPIFGARFRWSILSICECCSKKWDYFVDDDCIPVTQTLYDQGHFICAECYRKTLKIFKEMTSEQVKNLPLYACHENPLVRNKAVKLLESV